MEKQATIGANTEVVRSMIGPHSSLHFGYIADSIVGSRVKIGAGLIVANKRLDRDEINVNVKGVKIGSGRTNLGLLIGDETNIGIRVSSMPGLCIGSRATVFPGSMLFNNVDHEAINK